MAFFGEREGGMPQIRRGIEPPPGARFNRPPGFQEIEDKVRRDLVDVPEHVIQGAVAKELINKTRLNRAAEKKKKKG